MFGALKHKEYYYIRISDVKAADSVELNAQLNPSACFEHPAYNTTTELSRLNGQPTVTHPGPVYGKILSLEMVLDLSSLITLATIVFSLMTLRFV